ncbi:amino acid permease [Oerskovia sp. M15]
MAPEGTATAAGATKVTLVTLTAMVVGSMVGAGVFSLPSRFAQETGVAGALVAWVVAGTGMLMLAFVFQRLAIRKPDLDAGVYAYAKAGFGEYTGFFSAAGYWASACVGNVTYWVLIMSTLGQWIRLSAPGTRCWPSGSRRSVCGSSSSSCGAASRRRRRSTGS